MQAFVLTFMILNILLAGVHFFRIMRDEYPIVAYESKFESLMSFAFEIGIVFWALYTLTNGYQNA